MQLLQTERPTLGAGEKWKAHFSTWRSQNEPAHRAQMKGQTLQVEILDQIGFDWWTGEGVTSKWVQSLLQENKDAKFIHVLLNSPGGDYFEGVAIHNLLKRHSARVTVEIIGLAASAASVIAMAGDKIQIHQGAMLMIHPAWSYCMGSAVDFETAAKMLRGVNSEAIGVYVARTGLEKATVESMVDATSWIGTDQAKSEGWVDEVISAPSPSNPKPSPEPPAEQPADPSNKGASNVAQTTPKARFAAALSAREFARL